MGIRGVPPGITDPNLRGFLQDIRNALAGVSEKVTKLSTTTTTSSGGGGGGSGPGNGGGGNPPPDGGGGLPPGTQASVVLSISPVKPLTESPFTLTATVTGNFPTGTVTFTSDGSQESLSPISLANGIATISLTKPKGVYTFLASYSGDSNNYSAISNSLTVEVGSMWDGPPPSVTTLVALSGIGYIVLKWTIPYVGDLDTIEIWGSQSNNRATATKLGESNGSMFVYTPPVNQPTWYFWVRVRDAENLFSDYFPNTTTGVMGTALSLEDEIAATPLWNDLGTRLDGLGTDVQMQVAQLQGQIDEVLGASDYNAGTTYQLDDLVKYNGSIYRAKQTTTGNLPTNATYWQLIGNYTSIGGAVAAHTSQISTLVTGVSAEVSARETLAARVTTAEGNITTQAGYINNRYTKAEVDGAMASQLTGIVASYQAADTANLNSAKTYSDAAVTTESTARANAVLSLATQINTVSATAGAKNRTYRQATAPSSGMTAGDIWFDSDDNNKAYRYNGTTWEVTDDTRIAANTAAIQTETTARATADSAIASQITTLESSLDGNTAIIQTQAEVIDGIKAEYMVKTDVNGLVSGFGLYNDGEVSDFFVRADRFAVGNSALLRTGTCSIAGHTTAIACKEAGGTWTWTDANTSNIPFIVYSTQQTINAPDGSGKTLTVEPGVYMKTANIQKAFVGDAEIYGDLKSYSWAASGGPNTFPFNGWKLDKASNLALYGGSFALYDEYGNPVIQAGKIEFNQFKRLIVSASSELFTIPKPPNTAITPSTITLNAVLQNISGTVTWTTTNGTYGGTLGAGVQKTIDPAQMTTATVTFKASTTVNSIVYEDSVTLAKVQDGSDALWLYLDNEAHLVPADANGTVTSYAGAQTGVKVYRGAVDVTTSESWTISAASYTGLSGTPDVLGQTVGFVDGSPSMISDVATITVRASKTGQANLDRVFTISKAKQGIQGPAGGSGIVIDLSNDSHLVPTDSEGNAGNFSGCASTASIFEGATDTSTTWVWAVPAVTGGITGTVTNSNRTYTVTGMTSTTGTVTFSATKSGLPAQTIVFSATKVKAGTPGTTATVYALTASVAAIKKAGDTATFTPGSITFSATSITGNALPVAYSSGFIRIQTSPDGTTWTNYIAADETTATGSRTYPKTGSMTDATVKFVRGVLSAVSTFSSTLDTESVPVISDGATGAQGNTGPTGAAGLQGAAGPAGPALYTWIAYSNYPDGAVINTGAWNGEKYIGLSNNKTSPTESSVPTDYTWSLIKGDQGVPGSPGADGQPTYTWFAYANDATGSTGFTTGSWTNQTYIGIAANQASSTESQNPALYTWSKIQGAQGPAGSNGLNTAVIYLYRRSASAPALPSATITYTFSTKSVTGLTNSWTPAIPAGTDPLYVTAATASSATDTDTIAANEWASAAVLAQNGTNGSNGTNGIDGLNSATVYIYRRSVSAPALPSVTTTYTFASKSLSGLNNSWTTTIPPGTDPIWVSTATAVANSAADTILASEWATAQILAQNGSNGTNGTNGTNGVRGSVSAYITTFSASAAWNAIYQAATGSTGNALAGWSAVPGDWVWTQAGQRHAYTTGANPGNWTTGQSTRIPGTLIVDGTLTANQIYGGQIGSHLIELGAYDNDPNAIIQSNGFQANNRGWRIDGAGNAEFYNVKVRGDVLLGGGNLVASSIGNQFVYGSSEYFLQSGSGATLSYEYYPVGYGSFRILQAYGTAPGDQYLKFNRPGGAPFPIAPGQWYQLSAYSGVTNCQVTAFIDWLDAAGTSIVSDKYGSTNSTYPGGYVFDDTTYKKISVTAQAPSNAKYATVGFHKPQNGYYLEGYADITQVYFAPVPANYTAAIPWSPGGISLMDTLSLKTNSVTAVEFLNSSIDTDWSSQPSYEFGANSTSTITDKASLPITTNDVATNRIAQVVFQFTNYDSSAGWLIVYLKKYSSITGSTSTVESRVIDVPTRQTYGSNVSAQNLSFTVGVDAKEAATLSLDFSLVGGPGNYWKTGSRPKISYLNIICFTGKR